VSTRIRGRVGIASAALVLVLAVGGASVGLAANPQPDASTLKVGTCDHATYSTIQAAVTAASSGATIVVCPGTYTEQVTIPSGKNNLTLRSKKPGQAIIQAPGSLPVDGNCTVPGAQAIVDVNGALNTSILGFTIAGPGVTADTLCFGVLVEAAGSATVDGNWILHINDNPNNGHQHGEGVRVTGGSSATITKNTISDYQKNGVSVRNASHADVNGNVITGIGLTNLITQNGIVFLNGSSGHAIGNDISANHYTADENATGIIQVGPGNVDLKANTLHDNDIGVFVALVDGGTTVESNQATGNLQGILFQGATGGVIKNNNSSDNGDGIDVVSDFNTHAGTTNGVISGNTTHHNASLGLFADGKSHGNLFANNVSTANGDFDCRDKSSGSGTAGTADTWTHNNAHTSSPTELCKLHQ
jgi:parallel beta-helix repeat protein